jgi:hypothetical protein
MANWRRKALALFPDLRRDVQRPDFSIYTLFFELLPKSREAHKAGDDESLRRIYGYAEWCFQQRAKDMWNAAGVAFYEHLFDDHPSLWPEVVQWLSPPVIQGVWGLWEWRISAEDLARVKRLIEARRQCRFLEARLTSRSSGTQPPRSVAGDL